jgi:hypothetical protein
MSRLSEIFRITSREFSGLSEGFSQDLPRFSGKSNKIFQAKNKHTILLQ